MKRKPTTYDSHHYAFFSSLQLLLPSKVHILSWPLCSQNTLNLSITLITFIHIYSPIWMVAPFQISSNCPFSSQPPIQNWLSRLSCIPYKSSALSAQITSFILVSVSVAAETCLSSRFLGATVYSCLLTIFCVATDVVPLSVSRPLPRNGCCFRAVR
jgi:hypothetical protein